MATWQPLIEKDILERILLSGELKLFSAGLKGSYDHLLSGIFFFTKKVLIHVLLGVKHSSSKCVYIYIMLYFCIRKTWSHKIPPDTSQALNETASFNKPTRMP